MDKKNIINSVSRRNILGVGAGLLAGAGTATAAAAQTRSGQGFEAAWTTAQLRPSIEGEVFASRGGVIDQSQAFAEALSSAAAAGQPLQLGPGQYRLSNINLPEGSDIRGVPGRTKIIYAGDGYLFAAQNLRHVHLSNLSFDGENRPFAERNSALFRGRKVAGLLIENCRFSGSAGNGILIEKCGGRITGNFISGSRLAGIHSFNGRQLMIAGNEIADSGNIGIGVWRWSAGDDGSQILNNRIRSTAALDGGTGQNGNGVSIFQANNVQIAHNMITDSAFSAIRNNGGSNVQVLSNHCLRSAEVAIFIEFAFEGSQVQNNLIDDAGDGISISNFDRGGRLALIQGNLIRNITRDFSAPGWKGRTGVGIHAEADTLITNNVVEGARIAGIRAGWGKFRRNLLVTGNLLRDAPVGIMFSSVEGGGPISIKDNMIEAAARGIVGYHWQQPATAELAGENGTISRDVRVDSNLFS